MKSITRIALTTALALAASWSAAEMKAGVGKEVITPDNPMWMAGYAARTAPAEGKVHDLWAKAMLVEDADGARAVIIATDLIGMPANVSEATAALIEEKHGIPRESVMLTASHTHCGPVLRDGLLNMYGLTDEHLGLMAEYTELLPKKMLSAVDQAVVDLAPAELRYGIGETDFAGNRRTHTAGGVNNQFNPIGPVDHDVPVLAAYTPENKLKGVVFGYACHNTTMSFMQWCGDYAGFAQVAIEDAHPDAVALFVMGCGGDQNPYPRRELAFAENHGQKLATAVSDALKGDMTAVAGPISAQYEEIPLALTPAPTREEVEAQLASDNVYIQRRAQLLMRTLEEEGAIAETHPYPIQVWEFGDALRMVALAGEVVVDYSLRLKYELGPESNFIIGYANDCPAYIPSLRVLKEGGYEGESSMIYYGLHGPWKPEIEADIIGKVLEMADAEPKPDIR